MLPLLPIAHIVPDPVFSGGLPPAEHYTFPCIHRVAAPGKLPSQPMRNEGAQARRLHEGKTARISFTCCFLKAYLHAQGLKVQARVVNMSRAFAEGARLAKLREEEVEQIWRAALSPEAGAAFQGRRDAERARASAWSTLLHPSWAVLKMLIKVKFDMCAANTTHGCSGHYQSRRLLN